jgi:hypothetical protein
MLRFASPGLLRDLLNVRTLRFFLRFASLGALTDLLNVRTLRFFPLIYV